MQGPHWLLLESRSDLKEISCIRKAPSGGPGISSLRKAYVSELIMDFRFHTFPWRRCQFRLQSNDQKALFAQELANEFRRSRKCRRPRARSARRGSKARTPAGECRARL